MTPKEFYSDYIADSNLAPLNHELINLICEQNPISVFEFGMGTGKNLDYMNRVGICTAGLDISFNNVMKSWGKFELPFIMKGDETNLRHLCNFDVVFTCSVLDHILNIDEIIQELKRIANKTIFLAETQYQDHDNHYFSHYYERFGFIDTGFNWLSEKPEGDGNVYKIWKWNKDIPLCAE